MSYIRFCHDSDFYIFYNGDQFEVMISGARYNYKTKKYQDKHLPASGEMYLADNLDDLVQLIRELRKLGHRIPRKAFDLIKRDQRTVNEH